ncbi:Predicted ATPase [Amycolatopsis pretoriensis]|uniref:Predicted ATPase n=1 Tax=Amycolatopsis pretoriensis TaxID=218821 RepID=A0A1H5RIQ2_9PSEU|nr:NB-ARC domain-containing protein [Amycolatopsis pretoriensis]SEF37381.1 Predicted ATPase [Amycolatopsis pretoriensis]
MDEPAVDLRILGKVRLRVNDREVRLEPRQAIVLAIIAAAGGKITTDDLSARLGVNAETTRSHRARIRKGAGVDLVTSQNATLRLAVAPEAVDLWRFRTALRSGAGRPSHVKLSLLREAVALWAGAPLSGLDSRWVQDDVTKLSGEGRRAFLELIELATDAEGPEGAVGHAMRAGELFPDDDKIRIALWRTWSLNGQTTEITEDCRRRAALPVKFGSPARGQLRKEAEALIARARQTSAALPERRPYSLPAVRSAVYGRAAELELLDTLTEAGGVRVVTVCGLGGLGKTELVVQWGHRVAGKFPDGVLFADLGGFSPSGPARPEAVLADFAKQLGITAGGWSGAALSAAYRTAANNRAILVVLDNVRDHRHAADLVAAGERSCTVITTRAAVALPAVAAGHVLTLAPISAEASLEVLRDAIGPERITAEPFAAAKLMAACGGVPLAVRLVVAQARLNPGTGLDGLLARLCSASAVLGVKPGGESEVRDSLALSYAPLSAAAARVLQVGALHPGPEIGLDVIPFLSGLPLPAALDAVDELLRGSLLDPLPGNRFRLHDLVRAFARERADEELPAAESAAVRNRLLSWLLAAARLCDAALRSGRGLPDDLSAAEGAPLPAPADEGDGRRWFEQEHETLLAVLDSPDFRPYAEYRWRLPLALCCYHTRNGPWLTAERLLASAAEITKEELPEPDRTRYQAVCHRVLGNIQRKLRKFGLAEHNLALSITLAERADAPLDQANGHQQLSVLQEDQGNWAAARDHATIAGSLYEVLADDRGVAATLPTEIHCHLELGDPALALERAPFALELMTRASTPYNRGALHRVLMDCHMRLAQPAEAVTHGEAARACYAESGAPTNEVRVLAGLADAYAAAGRPEDELRALRDFAACYDRLRQREPEDRKLYTAVKTRLAALGA